ncbi:MarR family protein [mine drainage metagenome]|uniref:MarR family protein n=1 Tax=mine drainage metagenome TaxID=410659 RepID=A0A1J5QS15_9ZZZZ
MSRGPVAGAVRRDAGAPGAGSAPDPAPGPRGTPGSKAAPAPGAWSRVLAEAAARGGTASQVAERLGLPAPLVSAVLDHAERLGIVSVAGRTCSSACPSGPERPAACHGCPLGSGG